jgi:hypothetical protein
MHRHSANSFSFHSLSPILPNVSREKALPRRCAQSACMKVAVMNWYLQGLHGATHVFVRVGLGGGEDEHRRAQVGRLHHMCGW